MTGKNFMPPEKTGREKLAREVRRLGRQMAGLVLPSWGHVARLAHDRQRGKTVSVTDGRQGLQDELAVLLIYQPKGLLDSTLWQIRWMAARGVSIIVVTNAPLSATDRDRLAEIAHLVIERPNVGYDFGGYREGILQMLDRGIRPSALYLMNDSMWFPLSEDSDVLDRSRAAPEDIWGLFIDLDYQHRRKGDVSRQHIQSYFYRFSEKIIGSSDFERYWRRMPLINEKRIVIQLRELRLTSHFSNLGYSIGALHSWREVIDFLLTLNDEQMMRDILQHQARVNPKDAILLDPLLQDTCLTSLQIRDLLRDKIEKLDILSLTIGLHPTVMTSLGFPFLKKLRRSMLVAKRSKMVELGLHAACPEPIRREIETWDVAERDLRPSP
ncbi:MAG: rhamnan synthesis F family protein [Cereibacter changlensis]